MRSTENGKVPRPQRLKGLQSSLLMSFSLMVMLSAQYFFPSNDSMIYRQGGSSYAHEDFLLQECKRRGREAHNQRLEDIAAREDALGAVPVATGVVFAGLSAAAGFFSLGVLSFPILALGTAEVAWMYDQIKTQASESRTRSSEQWSADDVQCERDAERLASEIASVDAAEALVHFDFNSGAVLGGLVDIPGSNQVATYAIHMNY